MGFLLIVLLIFVVGFEFTSSSVYGWGWLSDEIVESYINRFEGFRKNQYNEKILSPIRDYSNMGLSEIVEYIAVMPFAFSSKYYINNVGRVFRWSKGHRMIEDLYKKVDENHVKPKSFLVNVNTRPSGSVQHPKSSYTPPVSHIEPEKKDDTSFVDTIVTGMLINELLSTDNDTNNDTVTRLDDVTFGGGDFGGGGSGSDWDNSSGDDSSFAGTYDTSLSNDSYSSSDSSSDSSSSD